MTLQEDIALLQQRIESIQAQQASQKEQFQLEKNTAVLESGRTDFTALNKIGRREVLANQASQFGKQIRALQTQKSALLKQQQTLPEMLQDESNVNNPVTPQNNNLRNALLLGGALLIL